MNRYSLTTPQQNIWNLQKTLSDTGISNLCGAAFWERPIDVKIANKAINKFIELNSGMRLQFDETEHGVVQFVSEYTYTEFPIMSFNSEQSLERFALKFVSEPFEMKKSALYRFVIIDLNGMSGVLACLNHLIADAWTYSLLAKELWNFCLEFESNHFPEHSIHGYTDFIDSEKEYFNSERFRKDEAYWTEAYMERPETCHIKIANKSVVNPIAKRYSMVISGDCSEAINEFCNQNNISQAVLFETAVFVYLLKVNAGNNRITIGVPVLNRNSKNDRLTAGMYVSTLPLTIEIAAEDSVFMLCKKITNSHRAVFRHQRYPYSRILRDLRKTHRFEGNLYDVIVSYQNAKTNEDITTKWYSNGYSEIPFALHIDDRDGAGTYTLNADYQTEVFHNADEVSLLIERLMLIINQIIANPDITVSDIEIVPRKEYQKVIFDFNNTDADYPRDKCVHELFREQVALTPNKTAVVFEGKHISYRQLDEMSNSLAHYLREKTNIKPNDIVPIISSRDWHIIVAMLGIFKAGAAYMPIDPSFPVGRIEYMCKEVSAEIILTYGFSGNVTIPTLDLGEFDYNSNVSDVSNINRASDNCYVLFTSGTTGNPKASVIAHSNLANFACSNADFELFLRNTCSCVLATAAFTFDVSIFEIHFSLLNGMTVVLANDYEYVSAPSLAKLIEKNKVDLIHSTPTKIEMLFSNMEFGKSAKMLKVLVIGAETFTRELYNKLRKCTSATIFNGYGPSEATVGVSFKNITGYDDNKNTDITIGKPISNNHIYILNETDKPLPVGVVGELCISGDSVGKGYLNNPELTAEKFVPDPFVDGKIMYRTGDLARWRIDGELEFFGRKDTQVKIRGMRVELSEIESLMGEYKGVSATVVSDKRDEDGHQYLVGYYTAECGVDEGELRRYLSAKLPRFMVPHYFVELDKMPVTTSGKIDRKNLPLPDFSTVDSDFVMPEAPIEKSLSAIWCELLKADKVGKNDDFFDLGGDSLLAISMQAQIENEFNIEIGMKNIMENPVLADLASFVSNAKKKKVVITATGSSQYTLLPQQKAIYAVCQKNPNTLAYNMPAKIVLSESTDREKLRECFQKIVNINPSLRTTVKADENGIYGVIGERFDIEFESYGDDDFLDFVRPFDLENGPLFRIGFTPSALLFDMHHIIADGESLNIILRELDEFYRGENTLPNSVQYSDYSRYFYNADFSEHRGGFKDMLKCDFEPVILPEKKQSSESCGKSKIYSLDGKAFAQGQLYARKNKLTDTMLFLGVYGILLSKFTNKTEVLSSVILTNRVHKETQNIVGMFVNTLPIVISVDGDTSEYFSKLKQFVMGLYEYQELPFFEIAEAVGMADKSVINTSFVYQADGVKRLELDNEELTPEFIDTHTAKFDLTFELTPNGDGCLLRVEYNSGKYDEYTVDRLFRAYQNILAQLDKEELSDINVLSKEEYQKVIYDFNNTAVEYAKDKCVHELISEQTAKTPDKIALVFENEHFTYKQLDEMSNSLAHCLRQKGIKPNDVVPIIAKRDWRIVVAMLGILKAGGAYMPVDPSYPAERIEYMLETANSRIALSHGYFNKLNVETIDLTDFDSSVDTQNIKNVNSSSDLCYIIFTSGSTGKPKGVALRHSNVTNYCDNNNNNNNNNVCHKIIKSGYESIVSVTNIVFDIFVTESLLPLVNGLTIYFANDEQVFSQQKLSELFSYSKIDVMQTTPTKMKSYIFDKNNVAYLSRLKAIILGGEALPTDLYEELKRYTSAEIFNIYGPAETTVWSTNKLVESTDITIGKPIANTQVYILDQDRKPLPIGVAGELCISGDGVGAGYLNRPELTAEKFIPNPFVEGKIMYCTGDLARWREDGEIEYLGRIDTQVKIRGLRIELGEIESVMSTFAGIQLAAVTNKRDENGRQYLVGYYTTDTEIDEKSLRAHLAAKLPKYMIPNYLIRLDKMPMTASGKTDRKNLPVPQMTASTDEFVAPRNELESALYRIVTEILETDRIGVTDDFFDFGGDSLRAIEYVAKAHNEGIEFTLQSVFDYPTIRELCDFIKNGEERKVVYSTEDFVKFNEILSGNVIDERFVPVKRSLGNVLLTGATGFLGAHILDSLMKSENGKIYCLVRSQKQDDRRGRLCEILNYYFGNTYDNEIGKRIIPIIGDVEQIGLSDNIPYDVQTVIHTAATVKHYGSYDYFRNVNVIGTENVIAYAKMCKARLIHISTISVSGNSMADEIEVYRSAKEKNFDETSLYIGQPLENVYIHSKFEAEIAVLNAILDGLDVKIIRVGNLTNRQSDFKFQPNYRENAFLTRVKAGLELGLFPDYLLPLYSEFSPIDATADGVVKIAQYADKQNVFHLNSNKPIYFEKLLDVLHELNIRMETVSGKEFNDTLQQFAKASNTEYIYEAFQNDMDVNGQLVYDSNIRIKNKFTVWFLKKVGFEWKQIDFDYIKGYIEYFRDLGYLEV